MVKLVALTIKILKQMLAAYELSTVGNKSQLVERLQDEIKSDEINDDILKHVLGELGNEANVQISNLAATITNIEEKLNRLTASNVNNGVATPTSASSTNERQENATRTTDHEEILVNVNTHSNTEAYISMILPEFDPTNGKLSAEQFVTKINLLSETYGWSGKVILFAAQGKLRGHAKTWLDAQPVFRTYNAFAEALITDFPYVISSADIHIKMVQRLQGRNEAIIEYYYEMLALGRHGKLDDRSIIQHIINGLGDEQLKRMLKTRRFQTCPELFAALKETGTSSGFTKSVQEKRYDTWNRRTTEPKAAFSGVANDNIQRNMKPDSKPNPQNSKNVFVCYNCGGSGHMSRNCTKPQRRQRCTQCDKVHRKGQTGCEEFTVRRISVHEKPNNVFERQVKIDGIECAAYIDSGSECHLIQQSCVKKLHLCPTPCTMSLIGLWGGTCRAVEKVEAQIDVDDLEAHDVLYVVGDDILSTEVLLGRNLFKINGVTMQINSDGLVFSRQSTVMKANIDLADEPTNLENLMTGDLSVEVRGKLYELYDKYQDIFSVGLENIGKTDLVEMQIELLTKEPIVHKPYRVPEPKKDDVRKMVKELLENEIIEESTSEYASPMLLVKKKNGSDRLCVDFRRLNRCTRREVFPTPNIDELIQEAIRYKFFSSLDLNSGYYQIPIAENSRRFTAFITTDGLYQFKRMPFGLTNAPAVFQRLMVKIHEQLQPHDIISYMDDILIGSDTEEEMLEKMNRVFLVLQKNRLTLNIKKCTFITDKMQFLGHQISSGSIQPGEVKTQAINEYARPTNATEIRRFLGLSGYFRKFVPGYAIITEPMRILLKKNVPFIWGDQQENAFNTIKNVLTSKPVLAEYKVAAEHELHTDASAIGLAGVLLQRDGNGMKPIAYYSRSTTENEAKFHSYELETLAVVEALERFRIYIYGKRIKVVTDCNAVTTLMSKQDVVPRIARWILKVQDYDVRFEHRAGQRMAHVDALSRTPCEAPRENEVASMRIAKTDIMNSDWLYSMQIQDEKTKEIIQKFWEKEIDAVKNYTVKGGRLFRKTNGKNLWVVPKALRWRIVHDSHDRTGHLGVEKTIERVTAHFWFPRLRNFVKSYVKSCPDCAYHKGKGINSGVEYHYDEIEAIPFKVVHMDHLGPFPISRKRNQHVLVLIDSFTKYVVLRAVKNTSTKFVIDAMNELIGFVGPPEILVTDRGTAYTAKEFQRFCTNYDIKHRLNAVRTPRANGQVERLNRTLLSMLTTMNDNDKNWDENLKDIQWSLNTMKSSVTGRTPHELLYNFTPRDALKNKLILALHDNKVDTGAEMQTKRDSAAGCINDNKARMKVKFDARRKKPKRYEVGALVLVENELPSIGQSRKLEPKFKGPFIITKDLGKDRYVIEDLPHSRRTKRRYTFVYAADKLKPWCEMFDEESETEEDGEVDSDDDVERKVDEVAHQ